MADCTKIIIAKLNGTNYQLWKYKVELLLLKEELWDVVDKQPPENITDNWLLRDGKAKATIGLLLEDSQVIHVRNAKTAHEAWNNLKKYHEKSTLTNKVYLLKRLCRMNLPEGGDMEEHIRNMMDIVDQLVSLGETLAEHLQVAFLLCSLPESYENLVTALEGRAEEDLTLEMVKGKLIQEYKRRTENIVKENSESVLKIRESKFKADRNKINNDKICFHCKKSGHFKKDCYFLKNKKKNIEKNKVNIVKDKNHSEELNDNNGEFCFMTGSNNNGWYIDSGASSHMCNNKEFFTNFQNRKTKIELADGRKILCYGMGDGKLICYLDNGKTVNVTIKNVLYVPSLETNLLSVKKLTDLGFTISFLKEKCYIKFEEQLAAIGKLERNLYKLALVNEENKAMKVIKENKSEGCIHLWHKRFGHRDPVIINHIIANNLIKGAKLLKCDNKYTCEPCVMGKMARSKFENVNEQKCKNVMDLIHTDICGPMQTTTPGGKKYFITFIDDFSRYTVIYLLNKKSEAVEKLDQYIKMVKIKFGKIPKVIRSDRGGEYTGGEFRNYLLKNGIQYQVTAPYSPQQNGVAERKNRTIMEMCRSMLFDSGLPNKYWGEGVMAANYLQNILPTKSRLNIPFEVWNGYKANVEHIRVFGCNAYMHIPDEKRRKLDEKAKKLTFVGYEDGTKGYRLLDRSTNKIYISRDVKFLENMHDNLIKNNTNSNCLINNFSSDKKSNNTVIIEKISTNKILPNNNTEQEIEEIQNEEEIEELNDRSMDLTNDEEKEEVEEEDINESEEVNENIGSEEEITRTRKSERKNFGIQPLKYLKNEELWIEPKTRDEALKRRDALEWINAMDEEINSMNENNVWSIMKLPEGETAIGCKWIFKIKKGENENRYKARIVAQGYNQKYGKDYDEIFAPVVKQSTFRLFLVISSKENLHVFHYDFKTAFLNGEIDTNLYMKQPDGYIKYDSNFVCKLNKGIYGLKQSARIWNLTIDKYLQEIGFTKGNYDQCLYKRNQSNELVYILIYVDDILIASKNIKTIEEIGNKIGNKFKIKCLGPIKNYLGIQVKRDEYGMFSINQKEYINKILIENKMENSKTSKIPIDVGYYKELKKNHEPFELNDLYRKIVGMLLYLSVNSRPDISVATSILARRVSDPTKLEWRELKRLLRYLKGTANYEIKFNIEDDEKILYGFSDADFGEDCTTRKSNSGYLFKYNNALINWRCKKQECVALSTKEAEFIALCETSKEAIFLKGLISDFGKEIKEIIIYEDNQSCLKSLNEEKVTDATKHVDIKYNFVKNLHKNEEVKYIYCASEDMLADFLTKPLNGVRMKKLIGESGVVEEK